MTGTDRSCYVCIPALADDRRLMARLEKLFDSVTVHDGPASPSTDERKQIVKEHDVVLCGIAEEFDAEVARSVEQLTTLGSLSIGLDHIDVEAFRDRGVCVVNVEEANVTSVAEHTWMLILAVRKRLFASHHAALDGAGSEGLAERPTEVQGKTLGIVGAGSIGYEVATQARAFDPEILAWTFHPDRHPEFDDLGVRFVTRLAELIDRSDIVTLHLPLSEKTRGLIDTELLADVDRERDRTLINTSRAEIVAPAVLERIEDGWVFDAAGLDVYPEGFPDHDTGRIYFTPHTAGITQEATRRMREEVVAKIEETL